MIDTNVVLEFILDRDRQSEAEGVIRLAADRRIDAVMTDFHMDAVLIVAQRFLDWERLVKLFLLMAKVFRVYYVSLKDRLAAIKVGGSMGLDYDDAVLYICAKRLGAHIVSYDRDLDKTGIRMEPGVLLNRFP